MQNLFFKLVTNQITLRVLNTMIILTMYIIFNTDTILAEEIYSENKGDLKEVAEHNWFYIMVTGVIIVIIVWSKSPFND